MISKKVDATLGAFWNYEGVDLAPRRKPVILRMENLGVPTYNELILVARRESLDAAGASRLRRFLTATAAGHRLVRDDPAVGVDALLKADKGLDRELQEAAIKATLPVFFPQDDDKPWGWQEPVDWANYERWMRANKLLKRPPSEAPPLTNEFLPGEGLGRPRADEVARGEAGPRRVGREEPAHLGLVGDRLRAPGRQAPDELEVAEIARGHDVEPPEPVQREHLDRPRPDLGDREQPRESVAPAARPSAPWRARRRRDAATRASATRPAPPRGRSGHRERALGVQPAGLELGGRAGGDRRGGRRVAQAVEAPAEGGDHAALDRQSRAPCRSAAR